MLDTAPEPAPSSSIALGNGSLFNHVNLETDLG
ncbi:uncharacterized protein METZ01_LOCUS179898 [marine metagenome]|uniref:Uncharacterized protein n=1 Tax=marine metagenome TaxID=408172 RepID=A0A382CMH6_9ZZZZ